MQANKWLLCWRLGRVGVHLLYGCAQILLFFGRASRTQRQAIIGRWSRQLLHICGMRLTVLPQDMAVDSTCGRMLVANHISWLDIFAINAVVPMRFVAKEDILGWPLIGWLVARADTVFIRRSCRASALAVADTVAQVLREGDRVAVFPEGTTTDGASIKPFKSSLFQAAVNAQATVQPLALRYPLPQGGRNPASAYYDDITLWQSLCAVLQQPQSQVEVHFLNPINTHGLNRQQVCQQAQMQIADFLAQYRITEGVNAETWRELSLYDAH